jgi:hypothetical protein
VTEHRLADLRDDGGRRLTVRNARQVGHALGRVHVRDQRQRRDPGEHGDRDPAQQGQGGGGVLALGLLERRHAVADGLDPGQRRAAGGEGAQQQEHQREAGEFLDVLDVVVRALRLQVITHGYLGEPPDDEQRDQAD